MRTATAFWTATSLVWSIAVAGTNPLRAQPLRRDGEIVASRARAPLPAFESLNDFGRAYFPSAVYEEARKQTDFDVLDIAYMSGGVEVPGLLVRPKNVESRRWPAILFNRGGTGDFGRIDALTVVDLYLLAKAGFVILATDYRFHGATAKRDEWGGADLDDVVNLVPAARSLDFVDPERLFMLGVSRGGTMTYLALKRGVAVRAAAVIAGVTDLEALGRYRPEFVHGDDTFDGWAKVWPDYARRAAEHYRERSPVHWAAQIGVPILILHSRRDRLAPVEHALSMAQALQAAGRPYALHVYSDDGHSLPANRADRNRQIVDWFLAAR